MVLLAIDPILSFCVGDRVIRYTDRDCSCLGIYYTVPSNRVSKVSSERRGILGIEKESKKLV